MARRIEAEPGSKEFAVALEQKIIPDIATELDEARKARDAWLKSKRGRLALERDGYRGRCGHSRGVRLRCTPDTRGLATAGLGLASGAAIPGVEWLLDWRDSKKSVQEMGSTIC